MKKTFYIFMVTLVGCNYGSSLSNDGWGSAALPGGGGVAAASVASGGRSGASSGGTFGATDSGSLAGSAGGSSGATTAGGGLAGGNPMAGEGGAAGSGRDAGVPLANGGAWGRDAGLAADSASSSPNRDFGTGAGPGSGGNAPAGGSLGTGGFVGAGGAATVGTGGATGAGGATGTGGSTNACTPVASPGSSGMKAGAACLGCHTSSQSPKLTLGGTVYGAPTGGSGVSGATVTITDNSGKKTTLVTGASGNFYTGNTIAFPATVQISKCPDTVAMSTTVTSGDCNSCHGSSMRIHLP